MASFLRVVAEAQYGLLGLHVELGGARDLGDVVAFIAEAITKAGRSDDRREKLRKWLGEYVSNASLFGVEWNLEALKSDVRSRTSPTDVLTFLRRAMLEAAAVGILLILDEINGMAARPEFASLIKGLVDVNATSSDRIPLMLLLCGIEERRGDLIASNPSVDRIFSVVEMAEMPENEVREFFGRAFEQARMSVSPDALAVLAKYSAGLPKIMHLVGDAAYWGQQEETLDTDAALRAVLEAAEEVGRKFVDRQVLSALRSERYRNILRALVSSSPADPAFTRQELMAGLPEDEARNVDNFLKRMKSLKVIVAGDARGEYRFAIQMVRVYLWLRLSARAATGNPT